MTTRLVTRGRGGRMNLDVAGAGISCLDEPKVITDHLEVPVVMIGGTEPGSSVHGCLRIPGRGRGVVHLDVARAGVARLDEPQVVADHLEPAVTLITTAEPSSGVHGCLRIPGRGRGVVHLNATGPGVSRLDEPERVRRTTEVNE